LLATGRHVDQPLVAPDPAVRRPHADPLRLLHPTAPPTTSASGPRPTAGTTWAPRLTTRCWTGCRGRRWSSAWLDRMPTRSPPHDPQPARIHRVRGVLRPLRRDARALPLDK